MPDLTYTLRRIGERHVAAAEADIAMSVHVEAFAERMAEAARQARMIFATFGRRDHHRRETPARSAMHAAYDRRRRARRRRSRR